MPAGAPPGKGGKKGGGKPTVAWVGSGPPTGPPKKLTLEEATAVFREVVKLRDKDSKPPCLRMHIWGKCEVPNCKFSHAKSKDGKGMAILLTNHQKKCCRLVIDDKTAKAKGSGAPPPKTKPGQPTPKPGGKKSSAPPPSKKPNAHAMPGAEGDKGKGKSKKGKGKGKPCQNCGSPEHAAGDCPQPPRQQQQSQQG